jgi:hypothetical protein
MSLNRVFKRDLAHLDAGAAILAGKWAIGSTGAVGTKTAGLGLSLSRSDVGSYTLQLTGSLGSAGRSKNLVHASIAVLVDDADPSNDTNGHFIKQLAVSDSAGTVTFAIVDEAGAVKEAPSGAVISCAVHIIR